MSRSEMSFAGPTIRPASRSPTPPSNGSFGGPPTDEAPLSDHWMQGRITSSQGQRTPTSDANSRTRCGCFERCPIFVQPLSSGWLYLSDCITTFDKIVSRRKLALEAYHTAWKPYSVSWMASSAASSPFIRRVRRYTSVKALDEARRGRRAYNATMVTLPHEPQNEMPNREAAWPQSQQCTLTCSLRGTALILWACRRASDATQDM